MTSVHPVTLTLVGGGVGLAAAAAAALGWWWLAAAGWLANRLLDGLDGVLARRRGLAADSGAYLDITMDLVVYAALPLGVAVGLDSGRAWVAAALLLAACYVNTITWCYLSALFEKGGRGAGVNEESTAVTMPIGLVEGAETIVLFTLMLTFPSFAVETMRVMAILVALGALARFVWGYRHLRSHEVGR